jgi:predicted MPP superfamily phosphohydrolase
VLVARDVLFNLAVAACDAVLVLALARGRPRTAAAVIALPIVGLLAGFGLWGTMRLAAYLVFVHAPVALLGTAAVLRRRHGRAALAAALVSASLLAVGVDAFVIEPAALDVTRVALVSDKVARPLRIVVIADIQFDEFGDHERRALRAAMAERADLALFAGDYVQEYDPILRARAVAAMNAELRALDFGAPAGAYAVGGNVDPPDWPALFADTRVRAITQTSTLVSSAVSLTALGTLDSFDPHARVEGASGFHVALGHSPDFALGDVEADLLVAGHTHGGQVRLPWVGPLLTLSRVPRAWASGATTLAGGRTLVVSRGVGMERGQAPRLRWRCRPEIVVIDVSPR